VIISFNSPCLCAKHTTIGNEINFLIRLPIANFAVAVIILARRPCRSRNFARPLTISTTFYAFKPAVVCAILNVLASRKALLDFPPYLKKSCGASKACKVEEVDLSKTKTHIYRG
jgi:hypothetical protein